MDRLRQILAILNDDEQRLALSDAAIGALETELLAIFDSVRAGVYADVPADNVDALAEIAGAVESVQTEAERRFTAAAQASQTAEEREAAIAAIEGRIRPAASTPPAPEPAPAAPAAPAPPRAAVPTVPGPAPAPAAPAAETVPVPGEPGSPDGPVPPAEPAPAPEPAPGEPAPAPAPAPAEVPPPAAPVGGEPVTEPAPAEGAGELVGVGAGAPALPELGTITPPAGMAARPVRVTNERAPIRSLVDGRDMSMQDLASLMIETREDFGATPEGFEQKVRLGRLAINYPDDRNIGPHDSPEQAFAKFEAVLADITNPRHWQDEAVVASGGFCAPPTVDYSIEQISGARRPVRDSLPRFGASRGSHTIIRPPLFSQVLTDSAVGSAIGVWTNTTDTTPGGTVKGCQTIPCPTPVTTETEAIYRCFKLGNFQSRAFPELLAAWNANALAAWARFAESRLLTKIGQGSTAVSTVRSLGAARDILANFAQAASAYRSRHRMDEDARLRVYLPEWLPGMMYADVVRQQASGDISSLQGVDRLWVRSAFDRLGLNVTFYADTASGKGQVFGNQGPTDLRNWPSTVVSYMFHEGAWLFLDGGELDLGVIRDATLVGTNDYKTFFEDWEAVVFRGVESLELTMTVCADGSSKLPITPTDPCAAS